MTFSRAKATGWTDDIDTITAGQINQIDINQSRAVDGTAGGLYQPSPPVNIDGFTATTTGVFTRGAQAQHPLRIDTTTVIDTAATQVLNTQPVDIFYIENWGTFANSLDLELGTTSFAVAPIRGQVVTITVPAKSGNQIDISLEGGGLLASISGLPYLYQNNGPVYARFFYNGSTWLPLEFSAEVSP